MDRTMPAEAPMDQVERAELYLSYLLRGGVLLSAAIIIIGIAMMFAIQHQSSYVSPSLSGLTSYPPRLNSVTIDTSITDIRTGLAQGDPDAVISLGLVVLIATPIMRVAASVFLFLMQRDYVYVLMTLFVLIVLLTSFALGKVG
jgi:uncharacterized membrane protein